MLRHASRAVPENAERRGVNGLQGRAWSSFPNACTVSLMAPTPNVGVKSARRFPTGHTPRYLLGRRSTWAQADALRKNKIGPGQNSLTSTRPVASDSVCTRRLTTSLRRTAPLEPMSAYHERQIVVEAEITIEGVASPGGEAGSENVGLVNRTLLNAQSQSRALRRSRLPYTRAASSHFFERSATDLSVLFRLGQTFPPLFFFDYSTTTVI